MNKHLVSLQKSTLKGQGAATHEEINLIGTPAEVIDKALAFSEAGVTHLLGLYFAANSVPGAARPDADLRRRGHAEDQGDPLLRATRCGGSTRGNSKVEAHRLIGGRPPRSEHTAAINNSAKRNQRRDVQ